MIGQIIRVVSNLILIIINIRLFREKKKYITLYSPYFSCLKE